MHKIAFASSGLVDGEFVNGVFIADLKGMAVTAIQEDGLPEGDRLGPVWHPDNGHITVGVLPFGGHAGGAVIVPLQLAQPQYLAEPVSGFDVPRLWSPDATYLAVTNWSGPDLANTGDPSLDLVSPTGFRVRIAQGPGYATADAAVGWIALVKATARRVAAGTAILGDSGSRPRLEPRKSITGWRLSRVLSHVRSWNC
jgi:hypothetical protein